MKKYFYFAVAIIATLSTGCFATQGTAPATKGRVEITTPMSGKEYRSNSEYWRAVNVGKSDDMTMAKKIAMQTTRQELAASVESEIKSFIKDYSQNKSGKAQAMYQDQTTTTVKQTLRNIEVVDEKYFQNEDGTYECYVCLEVSKVQVAKELEAAFAKEEQLRLEFDAARFNEEFEAAFKDFAEER